MATGALDANGIWQYGEDDSEPTFSGLLNKLAASTSTKVSSLKASDTTSGTFAVARIPNLQDLNGTLDIASGGTGSTTVAAAQDALLTGLVATVPGSVSYAGTSASASGSVGRVNFSNITSVSLNNVFSSAFHYRIIFRIFGSSTAASLNMRMRGSGTDFTGLNYNKMATTTNATGTTAAYSAFNQNTLTLGNYNFNYGTVVMDISTPNEAGVKLISYTMTGYSGSMFASFYGAAEIDYGAPFDGITFYPSAGNISGDVSCYAYNV